MALAAVPAAGAAFLAVGPAVPRPVWQLPAGPAAAVGSGPELPIAAAGTGNGHASSFPAAAAALAGGVVTWLRRAAARRRGRSGASAAASGRTVAVAALADAGTGRVRYSQAPILVPQPDDPSHSWSEVQSRSAIEEYHEDQLTKVICTLGPATCTAEAIGELIAEGMDVARFNMSHGDHTSQGRLLREFRQAAEDGGAQSSRQVGTMMDTKGPEIRTGTIPGQGKVLYKMGDEVVVTADYDLPQDAQTVALSYPGFAAMVRTGQAIRIGDGALNLEVTDVSEAASGRVKAVVLNDAEMGERKNCNIPGVRVDLPLLQDKDVTDLLDFALPNGFDYIALSFVQDAQSVREVRQLLLDNCPPGKVPPQLISKIENTEGLKNLDEIIEVSDGIMVARGDLGMEIPPERVFLAQKMAIAKCNLAGKFVITATQMLESMTKFPRPTRAEASDVANAVLDGSDGVMLSGETANGQFPIDSARMMVQICREAEQSMDSNRHYEMVTEACRGQPVSGDQAICSAAVKLAIDCKARMILALTESGFTAKQIAKYRPGVPIYAVTPSIEVCRRLALNRGVFALTKPVEFRPEDGTAPIIAKSLEEAKENAVVEPGDVVVVVHNAHEQGGSSTGFSNLLKTMRVS